MELEHFERRINKHEFFEKQAEMSRATLQLKKKYQEQELPESHVQLESKVQFLGAKVSPGHHCKDKSVTFSPRCMKCRHGIAMRKLCLSVRLSIRPSNAWIVTKWKKGLSRFLYHMRDHLA